MALKTAFEACRGQNEVHVNFREIVVSRCDPAIAFDPLEEILHLMPLAIISLVKRRGSSGLFVLQGAVWLLGCPAAAQQAGTEQQTGQRAGRLGNGGPAECGAGDGERTHRGGCRQGTTAVGVGEATRKDGGNFQGIASRSVGAEEVVPSVGGGPESVAEGLRSAEYNFEDRVGPREAAGDDVVITGACGLCGIGIEVPRKD